MNKDLQDPRVNSECYRDPILTPTDWSHLIKHFVVLGGFLAFAFFLCGIRG